MLLGGFLTKILALKIIFSLSYGFFGVYAPLVKSNVKIQEVGPLLVELKKEKKEQAVKFNNLPLSLEKIRYPRKNTDNNFEEKISAKSFIVLDAETGKTLLADDADAPRSIGSITKLVSALVLVKNISDWNQDIIIEKGDWREGNNYVYPEERIKARDLLSVSLIGSSNVAIMALARASGLTPEKFILSMNEEAKNLGILKSIFTEPTGLDVGNKSTAMDVALILKKVLENEEIKKIISVKNYVFQAKDAAGKIKGRRINSTNELFLANLQNSEIKNILGAKTGYIEEAGYCFAAIFENKNKKRIIVVVLGAESSASRFSEARALAEWVFKSYVWPGEDGFEKVTQEKTN